MAFPLSFASARIVSGVRFTNDYEHVRWFNNRSSQVDYFAGLPTIMQMTNVKVIRHDLDGVLRVPRHIEFLQGASYLIFDNSEKTYYAFITGLTYVNSGTTEIAFEIDMIQTYRFELDFLTSPVAREHTRQYLGGMPVVNTQQESIDYGDAYETKQVLRIQPYDGIQFLVVACKEPFHNSDGKPSPIVNGVPQGLSYYIHPFYPDGTMPTTMVNSSVVNMSTPTTFLRALFTSTDAVNNVASMYITDNPGLSMSVSGTSINFSGGVTHTSFAGESENEGNGYTLYVTGKSNYETVVKDLGLVYDGLSTPAHSKLLLSPYTKYFLTDLKGTQIEIHPENIKNTTIRVRLRGSMGTLNKTSCELIDYNVGTIGNAGYDNYNNALISQNPALMPVLNDYLAAFVQGNANSVQASLNSATFNGLMAVAGGVTGVAAGVAGKDVVGAVGSASSAVSGVGNAVLQQQSIQAKIKDIDNIPASLSNQGSNVNFDYGNGFSGYYLIKKQLKEEYMNTVSDYFHQFGYKVNRVKTPNLLTRSHFNYVQLTKANIIGAMPRQYLNIIQSIFEKGVTLWHVNDMLNYNVTNEEV